jgi:methylmalonyl-CoA carboxyltransferase 5S subunit
VSRAAYDIVKAIKAVFPDVRIHLHCHATTGVTLVSLMKAIEAGADCVDTAISSLSLGPGHNPTESLVEMLEGTGFATGLDMARLLATKEYFAGVRPRYAEFLSGITGVETEIFTSQIPGGMISKMESQLKQQGAGGKLKEVLAEVPRVREDAGFPPLVTPSSQIVGTQAVFNVLMGRYAVMTAEFADLMLGYYGHCIGARNPEVVAAAERQLKKPPITQRPADLLPPEWAQLRAQALAVPGCDGSDEDVLTHAMFPKVAPGFFAARPDGPRNVGRDPKDVEADKLATAAGNGSGPLRTPITYKVTVNGAPHSVSVAPA